MLHNGTEGAVLVVFPEAQQGLIKFLQVPEHLLPGTPLLVVLLPFLVSTTKAVGQRSIEIVQQSSFNLQVHLIPQDFSQDVMSHQAMSLLCFPKALLDFLKSSPTSRPYCIWPTPDESSSGLDTTMLQSILKPTKAISAKLEEDVRVVFISNSHLGMLHTMPSLVTKRANSPETQFWTYGYSAKMPSERWKVQEIYPLGMRGSVNIVFLLCLKNLGGIITFTSSALVEDLIGCHQLISQIIEHPLWDCYLLPEVLAASHLLCNNGSPNSSR